MIVNWHWEVCSIYKYVRRRDIRRSVKAIREREREKGRERERESERANRTEDRVSYYSERALSAIQISNM